MRFEYECPICGNDRLRGSFGDNVTCSECASEFETEYDNVEDGYVAWITKEVQ